MRKKGKKSPCIIKLSGHIKQKLIARIDELCLSYTDIVKQAAELGLYIDKSSLSVYISGSPNAKRGLTQEQIIYLCIRYGIDIHICTGEMVQHTMEINGKQKKVWQFITPKYDEKRCIEKVKATWTWAKNSEKTI